MIKVSPKLGPSSVRRHPDYGRKVSVLADRLGGISCDVKFLKKIFR